MSTDKNEMDGNINSLNILNFISNIKHLLAYFKSDFGSQNSINERLNTSQFSIHI